MHWWQPLLLFPGKIYLKASSIINVFNLLISIKIIDRKTASRSWCFGVLPMENKEESGTESDSNNVIGISYFF